MNFYPYLVYHYWQICDLDGGQGLCTWAVWPAEGPRGETQPACGKLSPGNLDCFDALLKFQIAKFDRLNAFCAGAARCQTSPGCPAENPAHASLSRYGSCKLPTWGFCWEGCPKWFTLHRMVWSLSIIDHCKALLSYLSFCRQLQKCRLSAIGNLEEKHLVVTRDLFWTPFGLLRDWLGIILTLNMKILLYVDL